MPKKYRTDKYYDVHCVICGNRRSTDFDLGMANDEKVLCSSMEREGWKVDPDTQQNICPLCTMKGIKRSTGAWKESARNKTGYGTVAEG